LRLLQVLLLHQALLRVRRRFSPAFCLPRRRCSSFPSGEVLQRSSGRGLCRGSGLPWRVRLVYPGRPPLLLNQL
jgi:hypothetical protein